MWVSLRFLQKLCDAPVEIRRDGVFQPFCFLVHLIPAIS